ncbi:MAG: hypothetical protein K2L78_05990, partial [Muribaculaceae bacterium]|nr:hypothetical protein [Muribaculaceae bacterium]
VLEGYNVYRDGLRVNTSPVTETSFVEFVQLMGKVTYNVSAVYGEAGESRLSEPLYLGGAGIESVSAAGEVSVAAVPGVIVVTGADGLTVVVSDLSGRAIAARNGAARLEIPVCAGFYLVKAGGTAFKVRVP